MHTLDEARIGAFMEKALGDAAGLFAGLEDRVRFELLDAASGLPER